MFQILAVLIEATSAFLPTIPAVLIYHAIMRRKDAKSGTNFTVAIKRGRVFGTFAFTLFITAAFAATGVPNVFSLRFEPTINLVPFAHDSYLQYGLNVLLFMPLGFLLPHLWEKFSKIRITTLHGMLFSLVIELGQLFTFRATDIDDLILNTLGTALGAILFTLAKRLFPKLAACSINEDNNWKHERKFYMAFAWLSLFLIPPTIANWLWDMSPFIYNR